MARRLLLMFVVLAAALLLLAAGSGLWLRGWLTDWLEDQGIGALEWSGLTVNFAGIRPGSIQLATLVVGQQTDDRQLQLAGRDLQLRIRWQGWQPVLEELRAAELEVGYWPSDATQEQPEGPAVPAQETQEPALPEAVLRWLPERLTVETFRLDLPCRTGRCALSGGLDASRGQPLLPLSLSLSLDDPHHPASLNALVEGQWPEQVRLTARLALSDEPLMTLASDWQPGREDGQERVYWQGRLDAPELPQADWLLARLADWFEVPANPVPDQPQAGSLALDWQLNWPTNEADIPQPRLLGHPDLQGDIGIQARLPQPWPFPGLATVQGNLALELTAAGRWLARTAEGRLRLTALGSWAEAIPPELRPTAVELDIAPAGLLPRPTPHPGLLPLQLSVTTEGPQPLSLESHLAVATRAPWLLQLGTTRLQARLPGWQLLDWQLQGILADVTVTGEVRLEELQLVVGQGSVLEVAHLDPPEEGALEGLWLDGLSLQPEGLTVKADYRLAGDRRQLEELVAEGPVQLEVRSLRHPLLNTRSWQLQGRGRVTPEQAELSAGLGPVGEVPLTLNVAWPFDGSPDVEVSAHWQGRAGSDFLDATLADWPPLLTFEDGAVMAELTMKPAPDAASPDLSGALIFRQLSGLYDRMAWSGLTGRLPFSLTGERLQVATGELTLDQVNPGIPAGPLIVSGSYQAPVSTADAGDLELTRAEAGLLGGRLEVQPGRWSLARRPVTFAVGIHELELGRLLTAYPMEGLSGTGTLNGDLPVRLGSEGVAIAGGRIAAEAPGGTLVFPADRLRAIGQNNPAMNLVAHAMENFRYSVLNSTIDYDEEGTLQLGLSLEGANPEVQQGQTVRLNVMIEENIPDLMTSLQLSGKVSDTVTERVRQMLQDQGRTAP